MRVRLWSILPVILLILAASLVSWINVQKGEEIPEDIAEILSTSCYGCHTTGARAEDAVKKLDFKKWDELAPTKKVSLLTEISEVIDEGVMPPEKFLKNYPEKALSDEDKEKVLEWTGKETAKLME